MAERSMYERFVSGLNAPDGGTERSMVFAAGSGGLLVKTGQAGVVFPQMSDFEDEVFSTEKAMYLGRLGGVHCFNVYLEEGAAIPDGFSFESLYFLLPILEDDLLTVASRAFHLANWNRASRFCGICGTATERSGVELAKICPNCGSAIYTRISPAIIIAIVKDNKLLLAHNRNFTDGMYSVVAGFVEPGESIEDCAERETFEELGIKIKNIRYFGSQPWPFPDSLMIGLTAEYESGELKPDGVEIERAGWYGPDEMPFVPGTVSIAGRLIEWFRESSREDK